uniref:Ovule protein n=1 Tax=Panagrellus redivivus TaxID=6233 RepID=A0A7E4VG03_PANRE
MEAKRSMTPPFWNNTDYCKRVKLSMSSHPPSIEYGHRRHNGGTVKGRSYADVSMKPYITPKIRSKCVHSRRENSNVSCSSQSPIPPATHRKNLCEQSSTRQRLSSKKLLFLENPETSHSKTAY